MPQYNFTSPGAMAGNAIEEFFVKKALAERQRMLDEAKRVEDERHAAQAQQQLMLHAEQERRIAEAQRQTQEGLETERRFRRAGTIAENALPGDPVDDPTATLLREQGFGGQVQQTQPTQGPQIGEEDGIPLYNVVPGILQMRGGSKYLSAQAQREATAANAEANRRSVEERAAADRELRALAMSGQSATRELQNEVVRDRLEREREKRETAQQTKQQEKEDARVQTQTAYDLATRLETHPGMGASTGAYEMRTGITQGSRDFLSIRDQLVAALTQPKLGLLKGPMSDKDVIFIKQMATRLQTPGLSEAETRTAIGEAKEFLKNKGAVPTAPTSGVPSSRRVGRFEIVSER